MKHLRKSNTFSKLDVYGLDKFDGPIFGVRGRYMRGQAYGGMLIGLHIWRTYIRGGEECGVCAGGILMGFYGAQFCGTQIQLQSFPKYLRQTLVFMWKRATGKVQHPFFKSFWLLLKKFSYWQEYWALVYNSSKF